MRRWVARTAILLTLGLGLVRPAPVFAHANLERAEPTPGADLDQAPPELRLQFSEAVDQSFSRVQVLNDKKEQVDRGDSRVAPGDPRAMLVTLPGGLPNGLYTVAWRTLSAVDGHTVQGAYPLIIGPVPEEALAASVTTSSEASFAPETAVGRWWFYVSASVLFGTLLAWQLVFRALFGKSNPGARRTSEKRARQLALVAGVVL